MSTLQIFIDSERVLAKETKINIQWTSTCMQYIHTLLCTSHVHVVHCTYNKIQSGACVMLHIYRSQELLSHTLPRVHMTFACALYILNTVGNIILTILPWSKVTIQNLQGSNFKKLTFFLHPIAAVSSLELERRAPISAGGPQGSPESSSLGIFWLALFFIIIHIRYKGSILGS